MEGINLSAVVEIVTRFGTLGVLVVVWWNDRKESMQHKKEMTTVMAQYKQDMVDMRNMYQANVSLVKSFESVAGDLKDIVLMNTQCWQEATDAIKTNQFCPHVRLEKRAAGVQG